MDTTTYVQVSQLAGCTLMGGGYVISIEQASDRSYVMTYAGDDGEIYSDYVDSCESIAVD